jgi:hypothetical protein
MEENKKFPEQVAPGKNTDRAFIKVARDGSPEVPGEDETKKEREKEKHSSPQPKK